MSVSQYVRASGAVLSITALAYATFANAADLYGGYKDRSALSQGAIWRGFYIGGNVGAAWTQVDPNSNVVFLGDAPGTVFSDGSLDSAGLFGGIQAGYNFQNGSFVYGVELDAGGMDDGGSRTFIDPGNAGRTLKIKSESGFYGDVTGRAGYAWNNLLFYGKGGFAWFTGNVKTSDAFDNISNDSGTFTGWTAGGGFEYMIDSDWTIKMEYMYFDFGNNNFDCCFGDQSSARFDNRLTANTVKIGFNYRLNSGPIPLN